MMGKNYYGDLCTQMYELLHPNAPEDELKFYLSYARKGQKIFEPLCGTGRFLIPFIDQGYDIHGMDLSKEMLDKLKQKAPQAHVTQGDLLDYQIDERFDYILIPAGSMSLFVNREVCIKVLYKLKQLLAPNGCLVFGVETIANRCQDDLDYRLQHHLKTKEDYDLILKTKNTFDEKTQTQYMPGIYELYHEGQLLQKETMDFQIHLYKYGEMESCLKEVGFKNISTYTSFDKEIAHDDTCEMLIYECY